MKTAVELAQEKTETMIDTYRTNPDDGLGFKPLAEGHKRFITTMVNGQTLRVRVPLHVWNDPRPHLVGQYARELEKMVKRARRGPGPGPINKTNP